MPTGAAGQVDNAATGTVAQGRDRVRRLSLWLCGSGYLLITIASIIRFKTAGLTGVVWACVLIGMVLEIVSLIYALRVFDTWSGRIVVNAVAFSALSLLMLL